MKKSEQTVKFRKSMLKYASCHSISATARRYNVSRGYVYFWRDRYDGTDESLLDRSSRPHSHPAEHTPDEIVMIKNSCRRCPNDGLVVRWVKLRMKGYNRSISGLYRLLQRIGFIPCKLPNPKRYCGSYEKTTSIFILVIGFTQLLIVKLNSGGGCINIIISLCALFVGAVPDSICKIIL